MESPFSPSSSDEETSSGTLTPPPDKDTNEISLVKLLLSFEEGELASEASGASSSKMKKKEESAPAIACHLGEECAQPEVKVEDIVPHFRDSHAYEVVSKKLFPLIEVNLSSLAEHLQKCGLVITKIFNVFGKSFGLIGLRNPEDDDVTFFTVCLLQQVAWDSAACDNFEYALTFYGGNECSTYHEGVIREVTQFKTAFLLEEALGVFTASLEEGWALDDKLHFRVQIWDAKNKKNECSWYAVNETKEDIDLPGGCVLYGIRPDDLVPEDEEKLRVEDCRCRCYPSLPDSVDEFSDFDFDEFFAQDLVPEPERSEPERPPVLYEEEYGDPPELFKVAKKASEKTQEELIQTFQEWASLAAGEEGGEVAPIPMDRFSLWTTWM